MSIWYKKTDEGDFVRLTWQCNTVGDVLTSKAFKTEHASRLIEGGSVRVTSEGLSPYEKSESDGDFNIAVDLPFVIDVLSAGKMQCDYPKATGADLEISHIPFDVAIEWRYG